MVEIIISYYKSEKFLLEEVARGNHVTNSKSSEKSTKITLIYNYHFSG